MTGQNDFPGGKGTPPAGDEIRESIKADGVERSIIDMTLARIKRLHGLTLPGGGCLYPVFNRADVGVLLHEIDRLTAENQMLVRVNLSLQELDKGECREAGEVLRDLGEGVGL